MKEINEKTAVRGIGEVLIETGVIQEGHFELKSLKHSGTYCNLKKLSLFPESMVEVCKILSEKIKNETNLANIDVVVGPAVGAIIPAFLVANNLSKLFNFTEKAELGMRFRDQENIDGKNILVIEDVVTTGGTIQQTIDAIKLCGGNVVYVAVLVDRSAGKANFGVKLISGLKLDFPVHLPENCPICKEGIIPLYKPGSKK